jgi:predicted CoA-binding protein
MPVSSDAEITRILETTRTIALLGASHKPDRASHRVMQALLAHGYEVYPVNPGLAGQQLLGCTVHRNLAGIPVAIDMVDVFRQPLHLPGIVSEVIAIGAKTLWTQLGVVDVAAAVTAEQAGLEVVMDRCPAIELPRLGIRKPGAEPVKPTVAAQ